MDSQTESDHPRPNDVDRVICGRLRSRRLLLGVSQADIASAAGLSPQQIHKYETGASRLTAGRVAQFASILKVPTSYFYDDLDAEEQAPTRLVQLLADAGTVELLLNYHELPKRLRTATLAYMRVLASERSNAGLPAAAPESSLARTAESGGN